MAAPSENPALARDREGVRRAPSGSAEGNGSVAGEGLPVSAAQRKFWLLQGVTGGVGCYNIAMAYRLTGDLRVEVLRRALEALVMRHEVLRTALRLSGEALRGWVEAPAPVEVDEADLTGLPAEERDRRWREDFRELGGKPFDLAGPVRLRAGVRKTGEREWRLLLVVDHTAADQVSLGVLLREWGERYSAGVEGRSWEGGAAPRQYREYVAWEQGALGDGEHRASVEYWRGVLEGAPVLEWPGSERRGGAGEFDGALLEFALEAELLEALDRRLTGPRTSRFMVLLAVYAVLLHRHCGQPEVVIGAPMITRRPPEFREVLGPMLSVLPFRVSLAGDPTFAELLQRVAAVVLEGRRHSGVPVEAMTALLDPAGRGAGRPVFQTMLTVQDGSNTVPVLAGLEVDRELADTGRSHLDLSFELIPRGGGLVGRFRYRRGRWSAAEVARWARQWRTLVRSVTADPALPVSQAGWLDAEERESVLALGRGPVVAETIPTLHAGFEATAAAVPSAVAVEEGERKTTYAELDAAARRLADRLSGAGVVPGEPVGVWLRRSTGFVVAILGVLKAGGAFFPFDPAVPVERVRELFRRGGVRRVVVADDGALPDLDGVQVLRVTEEDGVPGAGAAGAGPGAGSGAGSRVGPRDLAYLIGTSGTSGTPRLVAVEHGGAVNAVRNTATRLCEREDLARVAFAHAVGFDACVHQVFLTLFQGGTLVVLESLAALAASPAFRDVTWIGGTSGVVGALLDAAGVPPRLRGAVLGAEPYRPAVVDRLRAGPELRRVLNLYGPTEASIYCAAEVIWARDSEAAAAGEGVAEISGRVIGRPIRNVQLAVLDARGEPVPVGVPGELVVGGVAVARGYLGAADAAASPFLPEGTVPGLEGSRVYRTGDRVRWLDDGRLEFLGRTDRQVKLRGLRLDLDEIEGVLARHPSVASAAVLVLSPGEGEAAGEGRLSAFVVPREGNLDQTALLEHARRWLPPGMIPSSVAVLDRMPLTAHGKIDREALARRAAVAPEPGAGERPANPIEARIRAAWEAVLGRSDFGRHDPFFAVGGDSLKAVRLAVRLHALAAGEPGRDGTDGGPRPDVSLVFRHPTVSGQATALGAGAAGGVRTPRETILPLRVTGDRPPVLFVNGGLDLWDVGRRLGAEQPAYCLRLHYEAEALEARWRGEPVPVPTFDDLVRRYLDLLRAHWPAGPYRLGGFCFGGVLAYEMARRLTAAGETVTHLILLDPWLPGDGPRWRERWETALERLGRVLRERPSGWRDRIRRWRRERARVAGLREIATTQVPARDEQTVHALLIHLNRVIGMQAIRTYQPGPYSGPALVVRAEAPSASRQDRRKADANGGRWRALLGSGAAFAEVAAEHDALLREPAAESVAAGCRAHLLRDYSDTSTALLERR